MLPTATAEPTDTGRPWSAVLELAGLVLDDPAATPTDVMVAAVVVKLDELEARLAEYEPLAQYARARVGRSWRGRNMNGGQ